MRISAVFVAICGMFFFAHGAEAQQTTRSSTEAGQIEKRIERRPDTPLESAPIEPSVKLPAPDRARDELMSPFVLTAVSVAGATVFQISEFTPLYEEYLGKRIGSAEIEKILERITRRYTDDGYFLTVATAPPQDLSLGILSITVTEGYISEINYTGDKPGRPGLFAIWANRIVESVPARLEDIERYILLMGDNAGLKATPSVDEAPDGDGAYTMTINLAHDRFDFSAGLDNRGTNPVGPLQLSLSSGFNSLFGGLERTRLSVYTIPDNPEELIYGEIYSQIPVTSEGTNLWISASHSSVDIYSETRASDLTSGSDRLAAGLWHSFVRQQEIALYLNGRFDYVTSRQSARNDSFKDRLRVARGGLRFWFKDNIGGSTTTAFEYSRGLDILNASQRGQNVSRSGGESKFSKYTIDLNRIQKLTDDFWGEINGRAQYSSQILLSSEEFAVGGSRFGRGYDPSEVSDSRGAAASLELRHRIPVKQGVLSKIWLYGFYDIGAVWRETGGRDSLASAGGGIRAFPWNGVRLSLEVAKPLTFTVFEEQSNDSRVFFAVSARF